ncbi:branched-chain amino acid ABC transporter permease [Alphaproteobacteria bacterium]|jgi:branched-chain amino acid transport system permease protein|nr:branched-chain amino acid ABC transporter permease [Alphaproteobacteria bacterium]
MITETRTTLFYVALLTISVAAPFVFPAYTFQIALLWIMILFAVTWDVMGGQMGYNSLGNILFFGIGMYISAVVQVGLFYDVGTYTAHSGAIVPVFSHDQYFTGLVAGIIAAGLGSVILAALLSQVVFGLRGPYFAIGTLGIALSAGELIGAWDWVGGGGGIALPKYPGEPDDRSLLYYFLCFISAGATFIFFRWLYKTRFGLAINAIRDNEEKAEAMGLHTLQHKAVAWSLSAFFLGISGALFGNMTGFVEPLEVAFPTVTFGIFMVAMALLGGKGTLWGPVIGATVFHVIKEVTWTHMLGWQWVALGGLIVVNVVFFQQGLMGWAQDKWPERFGLVVDKGMSAETKGRAQ